MMAKKMAITKKEALQEKYFVAIPDEKLPSMKPIGFPVPRAPAALFRLRPSGYVANSVPMAGGETIAVPRPRTPQSTHIAMGDATKAVPSDVTLRSAIPERS